MPILTVIYLGHTIVANLFLSFPHRLPPMTVTLVRIIIQVVGSVFGIGIVNIFLFQLVGIIIQLTIAIGTYHHQLTITDHHQ